jgi:predicted regulator of Ras-like GTPase activity (Roadblock/LC7/MglB family)
VETSAGDLILFAEEEQRLVALLDRLCQEAKARAAFLIDRNGHLIAASGRAADLDTTSLASLAAGGMAATGGIAQLVGERGFSGLVLEGERSHLYIAIVRDDLILVVHFDRTSSVGLVRFRVRWASDEIGRAFAVMAEQSRTHADPGPTDLQNQLAQITDEDIENLLSI